jgi:adenosine/AMP kinase
MDFSYKADWCRQPESKSNGCPLAGLDMVAPEVGSQVLDMIERFGLDSVAEEANATETQHDAMMFGLMVEVTGSAIRRHNGGDFSGEQLAINAIKGIAAQHKRSCF